jgi:hypothetical protein
LISQTDYQDLLQDLRRRAPRIIGIDGELGAGKTTLAERLSAALLCPCVHLDSFLIPGQASYLPSIQYGRLAAALAGVTGTVIIEGVCLLAVLEQLALAADYLVFVEADPAVTRPTSLLADELKSYGRAYVPRSKAHRIISREGLLMTNSFDVDIAHVRAKTLISILLACGGVAQTVCGALLLNSGLSQPGAGVLKIMGADVSTSGLGGLILSTAVSWAYIAYLARPSRIRPEAEPIRASSTRPDAGGEVYELRTVTQVVADPMTASRGKP